MLNTRQLISDSPFGALLNRNTVYAETQGVVAVQLDEAITVFQQADFLSQIQDEYRKSLPAEQAPEFVIRQSTTNTWFYINKKQERTEITEVVNLPLEADAFDLVYYTTGKRFFGDYQALIHIQFIRSGAATEYRAAVYAYPENGCCRFFVRHLPPVQKYFQKKTAELTATALQICVALCIQERNSVAPF